MNNTKVSLIIVNFNGRKFLKKLFLSISNQSYRDVEVIVVDNNSSDDSLKLLREDILPLFHMLPNTKILALRKNVGFASANNIGVKHTRGEYILFLNNDTTLDQMAIEKMVQSIQKDVLCAGVAPKIYLSKFLPIKVFDSFGVCMSTIGSPYNRGIGLIDLGQYDKEEQVFGLCYACCLVRKDIFLLSGGLDSSYFAYFEDVDWSFLVRKMGFSFHSCPGSIVYHLHSGTSSKKSYAWKYYLIFRNYLRTVMKDFGKHSICRIVPILVRSLLKASSNKKNTIELRLAMIKVVTNFLCIDWYVYILKRFWSRKHLIRNITDESLFSFAGVEPSIFFDPVNYKPIVSMESLCFSVFKKNSLKPNVNLPKRWEVLERKYYYLKNTEEWKRDLYTFMKQYFGQYADEKTLQYLHRHLHDYWKRTHKEKHVHH